MQSLSVSLRQMLLTWLEPSVVPITIARKCFISATHLPMQTLLRKYFDSYFGRRKTERHCDFQCKLGWHNIIRAGN